jgi:asparagine synthase (glutamine-hydrolysing)
MCGITGAVWNDPGKGIDDATLSRMTSVLRHRGPDDEGSYHSEFRLRPPYEAMPGVGLGFRRLSIIDLATGHQPMPNEDESVWIVFNGEIYNFPTLRRRLEATGHRFRTNSDTETIIHLYEDEGVDCFQHLNGMFAIAIWDSRHRQLVLARDRLGKKPLVYRHEKGRLLFASELKSLLEVSDVPREIDPGAVDEYLTYQYVPHPNTIFRGIHKLSPGHYAVWHDGDLTTKSYWNPDFNHEVQIDEADAVAELRKLFESAVTMRMRSDVPLGAFLSGGIDSSLVAAVMQKNSAQPIRTFTIGFTEKEYDESHHARRVADFLGTQHEALVVTPDAAQILPKMVWNYDEPFADSSAIPTWYLSEMTRKHVTVSLSGDGGDELFAGYTRYKAFWYSTLIDRVKPLKQVMGMKWLQRLPDGGRQKSFLRRLKRFTENLSIPLQRRYLDWLVIFNESRRAALYTDEFMAQLPDSDPAAFIGTVWHRANKRDPVNLASLVDLVTYLPCDLMTKVDIASMAHSLEVRAPFLDYRLVEFAASLPVNLKFRHWRGKYLLRRAFEDLIPPSIWKRLKMGFGVPLDYWFRNQLRGMTRDALLAPNARCHAFFRRESIEQLLREHTDQTFNHAPRLWALLFFEMWLQRWC